MTSARWDLVTQIFDAALDQPRSARGDFVRQECKGNCELEADVLKLLAADEQAGSFLEKPAASTLSGRSTVHPTPSLLSAGSVVSGRFEIVRFIGQGGMGQVYEALDLELKGRIALKAIRPEISSEPRVLSRFRREVQLTRRITHPNVCRTFDIERHSSTAHDGTISDITFLTMELLEGETLSDLLRRQVRLTSAEALPLVLQMIEALSAAHGVGIVHRDFKPSNVILVASNNGLRVVVTDFGLARAILPDGQISPQQAATSLTGSQGLMGTLVYMAPEQFERGEATIASDIYSLGLVIYEMVTGSRPFADPIPFAEAAKRLKQPAPTPKLLVPDLDPAWEATICKCLEVEPEKRLQDVSQVAEELTTAQSAWVLASPRLRDRLKRARTLASSRSERKGWRRRGAIVVFLLFVSLFGIFLRHYQVKGNVKLPGGSTVLLTEIQNSTGDKRFDGTTELMRDQLSQSPYFNLMDAGRIRDVLTQMTKPPTTTLDPPTAREVALRSGVPRVIFGAVSRIGDSYVLDVDVEQPDNNPRSSRAQWENHWTWNGETTASSKKEIPSGFLDAVRNGSDWIRSEIGESANDIARVDVPPQDVTTNDWDALSEFAQAEKFREAGQPDSAIVALQNAVAADPRFALAYMRLGDILVSQDRYDRGYRAYLRALAQEQQQRLTRRERDRLEGIYALDTEDFTTAEASFRDYTVYYANDYLGWFYRGSPLMMMGRVEEAITTLRRAVEIDPARVSAPAHIARYEMILGNLEEASKWIQHLRDTGHPEDASIVGGQLEFLLGQYEEALAHFAKLRESQEPLYRADSYSLQARVFAELGQYQNAIQALEEGIAADLGAGDIVHRADKLLDRAYINFKRGQYDACLQDVELALKLDRSLQRSLTAGTILGHAASETAGGMKTQLTSELKNIEGLLPPGEFKPISQIVRAHLRGEILLAEGNWKGALDEFGRAAQLEAPGKDKEYLARALLAAAQHTSDSAASAGLRRRALGAYSILALKPGQVWEWPQDYVPGCWSDEVFAYGSLADEIEEFDARVISSMKEYLNRRAHADPGLTEVGNAKRMLLRNAQSKSIH